VSGTDDTLVGAGRGAGRGTCAPVDRSASISLRDCSSVFYISFTLPRLSLSNLHQSFFLPKSWFVHF
jgi:hypothetical protein